jgi:hypothetical protein
MQLGDFDAYHGASGQVFYLEMMNIVRSKFISQH